MWRELTPLSPCAGLSARPETLGDDWLAMALISRADSTIGTSKAISQSAPAQDPSPLPPTEIFETPPSFHGLTGRSPAMRQLILQMQRMAPHLTIATIEGDDGTGKTLAARALHAAGPTHGKGPFVPCLAAHFFAASDGTARPGWLAAPLMEASGGTLFLDRIHQLSTAQQQAMTDFLRCFEDRSFQRRQAGAPNLQGPSRETEPGLPGQVLLASSVPLRQLEAESRFGHILVSRLSSVRFRLPPLVERREDVPLLAQLFIQRFARTYGKPVRGLGSGTIAPLLRYSWPGNVRELEDVITAAALETESQWIRPIDLPPLSEGHRNHPRDDPEKPGEEDLNLDRAVRKHVAQVLVRTRGNKLRAAQLLGISRSTLYRILAANEAGGY